jgi:hypothetical protein
MLPRASREAYSTIISSLLLQMNNSRRDLPVTTIQTKKKMKMKRRATNSLSQEMPLKALRASKKHMISWSRNSTTKREPIS